VGLYHVTRFYIATGDNCHAYYRRSINQARAAVNNRALWFGCTGFGAGGHFVGSGYLLRYCFQHEGQLNPRLCGHFGQLVILSALVWFAFVGLRARLAVLSIVR
jgi:hypothetical protein